MLPCCSAEICGIFTGVSPMVLITGPPVKEASHNILHLSWIPHCSDSSVSIPLCISNTHNYVILHSWKVISGIKSEKSITPRSPVIIYLNPQRPFSVSKKLTLIVPLKSKELHPTASYDLWVTPHCRETKIHWRLTRIMCFRFRRVIKDVADSKGNETRYLLKNVKKRFTKQANYFAQIEFVISLICFKLIL